MATKTRTTPTAMLVDRLTHRAHGRPLPLAHCLIAQSYSPSMNVRSTNCTSSAVVFPTDEDILISLVRRQEEILETWAGVESIAKGLVNETGQVATDIRVDCSDANSTYYDHEQFSWTDQDGCTRRLEWGAVEDSTSNEDWEALGSLLDDLAALTFPQPGEVGRDTLLLCDHDLALLIYGVADEWGEYDEEGSPVYQRFLVIDAARQK